MGQSGRVMFGYLNDPARTAASVTVIDGVYYVISGDRGRHLATGDIELHGRDQMTINSGGEKIFAEEVERALMQHPAVYDAVVCGRPSERWGSEVAAVVQLVPNATVDADGLLEETAQHVCALQAAEGRRLPRVDCEEPGRQALLPLGTPTGRGSDPRGR
ncbi:MAG: AMP-binding enzyme [Micromonosporaceae bacterium]